MQLDISLHLLMDVFCKGSFGYLMLRYRLTMEDIEFEDVKQTLKDLEDGRSAPMCTLCNLMILWGSVRCVSVAPKRRQNHSATAACR